MTIAIPVILFFLIATLSSTAIVLNGSNRAIENVITQLERTATQVVVKELDALFSGAERLNLQHQLTMERGLTAFGDNAETQRYFSSALITMPYAVMTYVGFPDGQFYGARRMADNTIEVVKNNATTGGDSQYFAIDSSGKAVKPTNIYENFDPRKRPWFIKAIAEGHLTFTDMYSHFVLKEPTITASLPVYAPQQGTKNDAATDQLIAVFAVDFLTTWLTDTLKALPIGERGHVIIVDNKNQLVASTTGEPLFELIDNTSHNLPLEKSKHPITKGIAHFASALNTESSDTKADTGETATPNSALTIDGQRYFISRTHYEHYGLKWNIYTLIASRDYLTGMYQALIQTIVLLLIMAAISIYLTFRLTQFIVRPIKRLDQAAQALLGGTFNPVPEEDRADEIGTLTENFNIMGKRLSDQVVQLEDLVHSRTLELEHKNELLQNLAETDALTGIANRRRFMEFANQAIDLAARHRTPLGFIMMDIDHFKAYNDTYGHIAGDHVIESIANVLRQQVKRRVDIIARYGGEEFAAVLQDVNLEQAKELCELIREAIEALKIEHSASEYPYITISIGLYFGTIYPDQTIEFLVDLADQALYVAKHNGRNRVECLPGPL